MNILPLLIYSREAVQNLDKIAINKFSIPSFTLMQRAGAALLEALQAYWPKAINLVIFCGTGNNGGDGYVLAKLAKLDKKHVYKIKIIYIGNLDKLKGSAYKAYKAANDLKITIKAIKEIKSSSELNLDQNLFNELQDADLIVDALFGTGLNANLSGQCLEIVNIINNSAKPVLAVDIPSGLDANSGMPLGAAVKADLVVTFVGLKQGLWLGDAKNYYKKLNFSDLKIPKETYLQVKPAMERMQISELKKTLPALKLTAHKGNLGHVLVIGGTEGYSGSVRMAGEAALRAGAGLVSIATHPGHTNQINIERPELMCHGIKNFNDLDNLLNKISKISVILLGPGLGTNEWGTQIFENILKKISKKNIDQQLPIVIDADALNLLAIKTKNRLNINKLNINKLNYILTPHPGEAARLLNTTNLKIQADRLGALDSLCKQYMGVIVLKGSGTLVGATNKIPQICTYGNPGMATAGMGDILAGVIAGLVAQGMALQEAAALGVSLHAAAGDIAAKNGMRGLIATDLLSHIRNLLE